MAIRIGDRWVGLEHPPLVVAEMSGNHGGSLEQALALVDAAAEAGAGALKLQTYTADTMTLDHDGPGFRIEDPGSPWAGRRLYELYQEAHTPWDWHAQLFARCAERGLVGFSSPFDTSAVDFLEQLAVPAYKIASFESLDVPLLQRVARTGKPVIVSSGTATLAELDETVAVLRAAGCEQLIVLKCTSAYPAPPRSIHLRTLPHLRERYATEVGLSDHTLGSAVSVAAVALGAVLLEKHFTLDRSAGGVDATFSLEPSELTRLTREAQAAWEALGDADYRRTALDEAATALRRSIYVTRDLAPGDVLTHDSVRVIRPGHGLPPRELAAVLGKRVNVALRRGTPLSWDVLCT